MTVFMYFQNVYNSFEVSIHTSNIIDEFHKKLNSLSKYLELFDDLSNNKTLLDNKKRFFKHPIKTIKSIFTI